MLRPKKKLAAALGAVMIAGTAGLVALAPTATAGTVTPTANCVIPVLNTPAEGPMSVTVTADPATAQPGDAVTLSVKLGLNPAESPVSLPVKITPSIVFEMSGGATGEVTVTGPESDVNLVENQNIQVPDFSGSMTVPAEASGPIKLTPVSVGNSVVVTGMGTFDAPCSLTGAGVVEEIGVTVDPGTATLGVSPGTVEPGATITLSGQNWLKDEAVSAELCDAEGANCKALGTPVIGDDGKISGELTVPEDTADGDYKVKVTNGDKTAQAPLKVETPQAPAPELTITPGEGKVGTEVTVGAANLTPDTDYVIYGKTASGKSADAPVDVKTTAEGKFADKKFTVNDKDTTGIAVALKSTPDTEVASKPFTVKEEDGPPPGGTNGKAVTVSYSCETPKSPIPEAKGPLAMDTEVTITVPNTGDPNEQVEVSAAFKDNKVGTMPDLGVSGIMLKLSSQLKVKVVDDQGRSGDPLVLKAPDTEQELVVGNDMKGGPYKGTFKIPGGGEFSFIPGDLTITTNAMNFVTETFCTLKNSPEVSAVLKAEGEPGDPPGGEPTTGGNSNGGDNGGLANTGSNGGAVSAFALAAGTLVLGAVGVMLLVPYRRRRMQAGS